MDEIDTSSISLTEDSSSKCECIMNQYKILNSQITYSTSSCFLCPQLKDGICMECMKTCHKTHTGDAKIFSEKTVSITSCYCTCAESGHKVSLLDNEAGLPRTQKTKLQCFLNDVLFHAKVDFYYLDPSSHSYYCIFCFMNCLGNKSTDKQDFIKKEGNLFSLGPPACSCSNKKNHATIADNISCLEKLLQNRNFEEYLNMKQIPGYMMLKPQLLEKYLNPISEINNELHLAYSTCSLNKDEHGELITKVYLNSMKLLRAFGSIYGEDYIEITNETILSAFNFSFLNQLFPKSITKNSKLLNDSYLIDTKINSLFYYRVFYLEPKTKVKKRYDVLLESENWNSLHRLIIKKELDDILEIIEEDKSEFIKLFERIFDNLNRYNDHMEEYEIPEEKLSEFIIEFLEWCIIFGSLRYTQPDDVKHIYFNVVINNFNKTVDMARCLKKNQMIIKNKIETFIKLTYLNINDEIFYREVLCLDEHKVPLNDNDDEIVNQSRFDITSIKNYLIKKNLTSNFGASSNENFIELEEDKEEDKVDNRDGYCFVNSYLDKKFCFEDESVQIDLLRSLFAYKKENKDMNPEIQRWEIYDWLISENDNYIENLKSFVNCIQNDFTDDLRELMLPLSLVKSTNYFSDIKSYESLINNSTRINTIKQNYFDASIDEKEFVSNITQQLTETKIFIESILNYNNQSSDINLKMTQLFLYKNGIFDDLFPIYSLLSSNNLQTHYDIETLENIFATFYNLFTLLVKDNVLLLSIFFTEQSLNLFFGVNESTSKPALRIQIEEFYFQLLRMASKHKYKMNLSKFIAKLLRIYTNIQSSLNNTVENILAHSITEIILIIKSLIKALKLTTPLSKHKSNTYIMDFMNKLLTSTLYQNLWSNYKMYYNEKSLENLKSKPHEIQFIHSILKLIIAIDDYHFYLITDNIPQYDIRDLLEDNINEMEPDHRRLLSMVYSRFYAVSPFTILNSIANTTMDTMCEGADNNLNGRAILSKEEEEETKEGKELSKPLKGMSFLDKKVISKKTTKHNIIPHKSLFDSADAGNSLFKVLNVSEKSLGLDPIYNNLSKYKRQMKLYMNTYFQQHPKMFVKYFRDVILIPSIFCVYKVLYFTPVLTAKYKYLAYKTIYLFLECYKYFTEVVLFDEGKFGNDEEYIEHINAFFVNDNSEGNLMDAIRLIKDRLSTDVPKIGKDPKFEPLKTKQLLDYYAKYIKTIKCIDFLVISQIAKEQNVFKEQHDKYSSKNIHQSKQQIHSQAVNDFNNKIHSFIEFYTERKCDTSNNVLIHIFETPTGDDDIRGEELKRTIILDLLYRINFAKKSDSKYSQIQSETYTLVNCINKVYKADPDLWHEIIADTASQTKLILKDIIENQLTFLIQLVYIDYHKLNPKANEHNDNNNNENDEPDPLKYFLILIEYLRLHCENHHKIFQTILTNATIIKLNYMGKRDRLDLVNFILKIPVLAVKNMRYYTSKSEMIKEIFKSPNLRFFDSLLTGVTDYLIEIIQGSFESNMLRFSLGEYTQSDLKEEANKKGDADMEFGNYPNIDFDNYIDAGYICFDSLDSQECEFILSQFFRFIICFFEESLNPKSNKEKIVKKFNPKKLLLGLAHSTSNLYLRYKENKTLSNDYALPEEFSDELVNLYLKEESFQDNYLFILSSNIFRFLKQARQWKCGEKIDQYLSELKAECEENAPIGEKNRNYIIGRREAFRFYSKIVGEVEVYYKPKETLSELERRKYKEFFDKAEDFRDNENNFKIVSDLPGRVQKVVYLLNPCSLFVKDQDMVEFAQNAPFEKNVKLNYLLSYIPTMQSDIEMRKNLWEKENKILSLLYQINYKYANYISIFMTIIVNILLLISSFYQIEERTHPPYNTSFNSNESSSSDYEMPIDEVIKTRKELNSNHIFTINLIHLIFLILIISNWIYFALWRCGWDKRPSIFGIITMIFTSEIFPLGWNFVSGFIGLLNMNFHFIFSLQLFSMITLFETMQTVVYSVRIKSKQFLSAGLLMMIFSLFFAMVKFYWFTDEFSEECVTFGQCFLSMVTDGIRGGAGMGFSTKRISDKQYYSEFIFEWVFYFSIILILLNVINSIIVDTFQALREEAAEQYETKMNLCFICSLNRSIFERNGLDFENHKEQEHSILNYFHYIFKVIKTDEQELNSLDYQVLLSYKQTKTDFFPVKTAMALTADNDSKKESK